MIRKIFLILLPICTIAGELIVGYYPSWNRAVLPHDKVDFENLTHIAHAFIWPETDGSISTYSNFYYPDLVNLAHQTGKKIIVAIGGWGQSYGFSSVVADSTKRERFINNITDFCFDNSYDGVDIDWEYPKNANDKTNLTLFITELRESFDEIDSSLVISMAIPAGWWSGQWFDYESLKYFVNWFTCMTYDFHGPWTDHAGHNSPLYAPPGETEGSIHQAIQYLISRAIPRELILMGLPFYGREFNASELYGPSTGGDAINYNQIVELIDSNWTYCWDDISKVPYLINSSNTKIVSFDDTVSIAIKCQYVVDNDLGGVGIWALGQDYTGDFQPLLETAGTLLDVKAKIEIVERKENFANSVYLIGNYPNPFNESTIIKYYLEKDKNVKVEVFDIRGNKLFEILDSFQEKGWHSVNFNNNDLCSGIYFYKVTTPSSSESRKMILIR